jgi:hypothetical protein
MKVTLMISAPKFKIAVLNFAIGVLNFAIDIQSIENYMKLTFKFIAVNTHFLVFSMRKHVFL